MLQMKKLTQNIAPKAGRTPDLFNETRTATQINTAANNLYGGGEHVVSYKEEKVEAEEPKNRGAEATEIPMINIITPLTDQEIVKSTNMTNFQPPMRLL
jgi:hypothetical protein